MTSVTMRLRRSPASKKIRIDYFRAGAIQSPFRDVRLFSSDGGSRFGIVLRRLPSGPCARLVRGFTADAVRYGGNKSEQAWVNGIQVAVTPSVSIGDLSAVCDVRGPIVLPRFFGGWIIPVPSGSNTITLVFD